MARSESLRKKLLSDPAGFVLVNFHSKTQENQPPPLTSVPPVQFSVSGQATEGESHSANKKEMTFGTGNSRILAH